MTDVRKTALLSFLAVFVAVLAAGAVVGLVFTEDSTSDSATTPGHVEIDNPQYDAERVSSDRTPGEASIEMDTTVFDNEVVVHVGGTLAERDIAPLVNTLVDAGHEVTVIASGGQQFVGPQFGFSEQSVSQVAPPPGQGDESQVADALEDAHGYISLGVSSYSEADLEAISEFLEDDGRVVMAVDPNQEFARGAGNSETFSELGVYTEPGYVYNLEENDLNYQRIYAEPAGDSMLTEDVDRVLFDTATPVLSASTDETLEPIAGNELSTTREETDKPVLVRDGNVVLIGDTGFMKPENTQRADNDQFVANIAEFLVESNRVFHDQSGDDTQENTETVTIEVGPDGENRFEPEVTEIEPGTTVVFEWQSEGYNVVPVYQEPSDSDWDGVEEIQDEGFVHEYTFEEEGIHEFVSEPHEDDFMFGVIVVGDP